jgi:hypothetical protein
MQGLRIYIAGPMESVGGNWNMPLFDYVAKKLRELGCEVFSPAELIRAMHGDLDNVLKMEKAHRKFARKEALKDAILWIINEAQLMFLLPGWERSPGATAERAVALAIGVKIYESGTILLPLEGDPGKLDLVLDFDPAE